MVMQMHYHIIHKKPRYILIAMSAHNLQTESTLTDRYQTTVPHIVRETLSLTKRDKILYVVQQDSSVLISKIEVSEEDPALSQFLSYLSEDITNNPQNVKGISNSLVSHIQSLVSDVEIDLDSPLSDTDE